MGMGINGSMGNNFINSYGGFQSPMMGGLGRSGFQNPMMMMQMMMQMMMKMMQMMMGGQSMPMMGGMPGLGNMSGMGGFSPDLGNNIGNFLGNPGGDFGGAAAGAGEGGNGGAAAAGVGDGGNGGAAAASGGNAEPVNVTPSDGSGNDAAALAEKFLGRDSYTLKGELPNFTAAGGRDNNCADFVSSVLESTGRLKGHHINVKEMEKALREQGYVAVPLDKARAGDVWMNDSRGHVELVGGSKDGKLQLIGSNNSKPGDSNTQQVSRDNSESSGVVYHKVEPEGKG